jgi:hypothetical protein
VSNSFILPSLLRPLCAELGVEIEPGGFSLRNRPSVPHLLRYEAELDWLRNHSSEVERVFHADAFDIFFQKDPFSESVRTDELIFVGEPQLVKACGWNYGWMSRCYNATGVSLTAKHFILCSGSIIGGVDFYVRFLELMIGQPEWETCWDHSMDQAMLNYLVRSGKVSGAGIRYRIVGCESDFFTMAWCVVDKRIAMNADGDIVSRGRHVPAFVHQYNRFDDLYIRLNQICKVGPVVRHRLDGEETPE